MKFHYRPALHVSERDAIFLQMQTEGLLGCAMYAFAHPSLEDWRRITAPDQGLTLLCQDASGQVLACGLFSPRRGRVWEFDFTTFRAFAHLAVPMARQGFQWMFSRQDCSALLGLCPRPNRHAWQLAERCGFKQLGVLPQACFYARKGRYVDGVLVCCSPEQLASSMADDTPASAASCPRNAHRPGAAAGQFPCHNPA